MTRKRAGEEITKHSGTNCGGKKGDKINDQGEKGQRSRVARGKGVKLSTQLWGHIKLGKVDDLNFGWRLSRKREGETEENDYR